LNLKSFATRSLIAVIFGPLIILAALYGSFYWLTFVIIVAVASVIEFCHLSENKGAKPKALTAAIFTFAIITSLYFYADFKLVPLLILALVFILFSELYQPQGSPILNSAVSLMGILYYGLLFGSFVLIRQLPTRYGLDDGPAGLWIVMIILATWICDTAAYVVGSYFGKHKLIERISPNKTIEGTVAGFLFAILTAYLSHIWFIKGLSLTDSLIIGAVVGSFGQYGDLFESMFKRDAGVKDSSNIIPGHGGIMDRFDSLSLSAPIIYLYLRIVVF